MCVYTCLPGVQCILHLAQGLREGDRSSLEVVLKNNPLSIEPTLHRFPGSHLARDLQKGSQGTRTAQLGRDPRRVAAATRLPHGTLQRASASPRLIARCHPHDTVVGVRRSVCCRKRCHWPSSQTLPWTGLSPKYHTVNVPTYLKKTEHLKIRGLSEIPDAR